MAKMDEIVLTEEMVMMDFLEEGVQGPQGLTGPQGKKNVVEKPFRICNLSWC